MHLLCRLSFKATFSRCKASVVLQYGSYKESIFLKFLSKSNLNDQNLPPGSFKKGWGIATLPDFIFPFNIAKTSLSLF